MEGGPLRSVEEEVADFEEDPVSGQLSLSDVSGHEEAIMLQGGAADGPWIDLAAS